MADTRVVAVKAMQSVLIDGRSFTTVLADAERQVPPEARSHLRALCFEWARWGTQLEAMVDDKLDKPLRNKDQDVYLLMELGILDLVHMKTPAHVAVNECVKALKGLKKPWAKGLVNAVLRNTQREPVDVSEAGYDVRYAYPDWWVTQIKKDWKSDATSILASGNERAPMTLRVNRCVQSVDAAKDSLKAIGIDSSAHPYAPDALVLAEPVAVSKLPGFADGALSVQDAAAQMIVPLLNAGKVQPLQILDACSAPGGKSAHLLEAFESATLTALDHAQDRLQRVTETLTRLNLQDRVETQCADAGDLSQWWDNTAFDLVLLDAPCTGSGVIRRHPDIKHTRRESDIDSLAVQQSTLLNALWETVCEGGYLLYATCSIIKAENVLQIQAFLDRHDNAVDATPKGIEWARPQEVGYQVLPGENDMDGFYYALIQKAAHGNA